MPTLGQLSEARVSAGLQAIINGFAPGSASTSERLRAGADAARSALEQYGPLRFDPSLAATQMREIDAWATRNQEELERIMASTTQALPQELVLTMGSERAQAFVHATYFEAASGLPAWISGAVTASVQDPSGQISERWAREDAQDRLQAFATIVALDRDGTLEAIFRPPEQGNGSLGSIPYWFIAIVLVVLAAAIVTTVILLRRVSVNNRLLRDLCEEALERGDREVYERCIELAADSQGGVVAGAVRNVLYAAFAAGAVYLALRFYGEKRVPR